MHTSRNTLRSWRRVKRSGSYWRLVKKQSEEFEKECSVLRDLAASSSSNIICNVQSRPIVNVMSTQYYAPSPSNLSPHTPPENNTDENIDGDDFVAVDEDEHSENDGDASDEDCIVDEFERISLKKSTFENNLKKWAFKYKISHLALRDFLQIFNEYSAEEKFLPDDPRTLLQTERNAIPVVPLIGGGEYWHNGLEKCLRSVFKNLQKPISISLNINIDGLPLFNSSKVSFWPILCNIAEMPSIRPMVVGVYCGATKITDLETYFTPFVDEMEAIMANGLNVNEHHIKVGLRCFVCDSPARSFVKGKCV